MNLPCAVNFASCRMDDGTMLFTLSVNRHQALLAHTADSLEWTYCYKQLCIIHTLACMHMHATSGVDWKLREPE